MSEKVTVNDIPYPHGNPFESITKNLLLDNLAKINYDYIQNKYNKKSPFVKVKEYVASYFSQPDSETGELNRLYEDQENAIVYEDWLSISLMLDKSEGNDAWKETEESSLYDYRAVREQLDKLRKLKLERKYEEILYIIRTEWRRDFANINNERLYKKCHVGTKSLIREYIDECVSILKLLVSDECFLDDDFMLDILMESKRNYGRTAITMSGGGSFGLIGIGVFSTLLENELFPKIISGSSAGSIVSSIMCSKTSDELKHILRSLFDRNFQVFDLDSDNDSFYTHLSRLLKHGVWFDSKNLQATMKEFLGNMTFREAFNKTGSILNITVSSVSVHDQPTLLNYLTAPNVLIWSAVCASCSLPVVFASSTIYEKNLETGEIEEWSNPSLKFVDGSLKSDLPISRLSEMFNVNHTIACQVNPHISPLVKLSSECEDLISTSSSWSLKMLSYNLSNILTMEVVHYCDLLIELGILSNFATKIRQLFTQSYTGDITILPELKLDEQKLLLSNPTPTFLWECILKGSRATWPSLSFIKDQNAVEFTMDKCIAVLKSRVVFEKRFSSSTALSIKKFEVTPPRIHKSQSIVSYTDLRRNSTDRARRETDASTRLFPKVPSSTYVAANGKNKRITKKHRDSNNPITTGRSFESFRQIKWKVNAEGTGVSPKKRQTRSFSFSQPHERRNSFKEEISR